jgi:O-antigen/teichoic acid export membrane protein
MKIKSLFRNSFFSLLSQLVLLVFGFLSQRAMNLYMGTELVGMNGVIANVISMLSVTELGVSTAIVYHLYSVLVSGDERKIAALMNLYRKAYYVFAAALMALGMVMMPFVHLFMTNNSYSIGYIRVLYFLWLLRSALSYLLSYKKSLLVADQNEYVVSVTTILANVIGYSSIILFVSVTGRYLPALLTGIIGDTLLNIWVSRYTDKQYPFLRQYRTEKTESETLKNITQDIKNIFVSRLSQNLLNGTDNLIISGFINVATVGIFSNYGLIMRSVGNIIRALATSIQPGIGNLFVEKDHEKDYRVLRQMTFLFFLIVAVAACGLYVMTDYFVEDIWLGKAFGWDRASVFLSVTGCVLLGIGQPIAVVMAVSGLFHREKTLSVVSSVANLIVSIALVIPFGTAGVLLGTCLAYLIQIGYRIHIFFHEYVEMDEKWYLLDLLEYGVLMMAEVILTKQAVELVYRQSLLTFLLGVGVCVVIPMACNVLIFWRSNRLKSIIQLFSEARP